VGLSTRAENETRRLTLHIRSVPSRLSHSQPSPELPLHFPTSLNRIIFLRHSLLQPRLLVDEGGVELGGREGWVVRLRSELGFG